jgi:aspartate kinase
MALIVQKYGGTSVADLERIRNVAGRVARTRAQGHDVVVVVSGRNVDDDAFRAWITPDVPESGTPTQ